MKHYALIYWDLRTGAPKKGVEQRSEVIGMLSSEVFKMSTSEEMAAYIANLSKEKLSEITKNILKNVKRNMNEIKNP